MSHATHKTTQRTNFLHPKDAILSSTPLQKSQQINYKRFHKRIYVVTRFMRSWYQTDCVFSCLLLTPRGRGYINCSGCAYKAGKNPYSSSEQSELSREKRTATVALKLFPNIPIVHITNMPSLGLLDRHCSH